MQMESKTWYPARGIILVTLMLAPLTGCYFWESDSSAAAEHSRGTPVSALRLYNLKNCDDYRAHLSESLFRSWTQGYLIAADDGGVVADSRADAPAGGGAEQSKSVPDGVSQTNVQEFGVDEADLVKTAADGTLYILQGEALYIEKGFPPENLTRRSRLDLGVATSSLYLDEAGHRLVVFANYSEMLMEMKAIASVGFPSYKNRSQVIFIDVQNPDAPVITARLHLDGYQLDSRRVGERIHLVSRFENPVPAPLLEDKEFERLVQRYIEAQWQANDKGGNNQNLAELEQQIQTRIDQALQAVDVQQLLPMGTWDRQGEIVSMPLLTCEAISRPQVEGRAGLQVVSSFDMSGDRLLSSAITGDAWEIYGRPDALYLAQTSGNWWWSSTTKAQTVIHKFAVSEGSPEYLATGAVDGWIKDQFSLSEYDGYLRLATTTTEFDAAAQSRNSSNALFVLQDTGAGDLAPVGEVRDYGLGETIFSVRFLETRAFVVTFRRIDPLFSFDLSDPQHPRLAGEVEIPGFSTYMHPLDDQHLLTIGVAGDAGGAGNQLQLQVFDVSDLSDPKRVFSHIPQNGDQGYSWSEAMYNHLAFNYYAPRKLLVLPLTSYDRGWNGSFSGFALFHVDAGQGFSDLGRIDHKDLAYQSICEQGNVSPDMYPYYCNQEGYVYQATPRRSVIMTAADETYLYTISNAGLKASDLVMPNTALGSDTFTIF